MMLQAETTSDEAYLREFVERQSEGAFRELVERHLTLVRAAAGRQLGDRALADDVAQAVFILLARKARSIRQPGMLPGWLVKATYFACRDARKIEARRKRHEQRAAAMNIITQDRGTTSTQMVDPSTVSPLLDQALARLREGDRAVVTLRYLEGQSMSNVSAAVGISEAAAAKRIERALRKMRSFFARNGVTIPQLGIATAIGAVIAGSSATAATLPAAHVSTMALAAAHSAVPAVISGVAAAATPVSLSIAQGTGQLMLIAKIKTVVALVSVVAISAAGGAAAVIHVRAQGAHAAPTAIASNVKPSNAPTAPAALPVATPPPAAAASVPDPATTVKSTPLLPPRSNGSFEGITGTVRLEGKPPEMSKIDTSSVPQCHAQHKQPLMEETVIVGEDGGLANVVVSIKKEEGMTLPGDDAPSQFPAVLDQQGCQYFPHVVAIQVGQPILVKNNDPFLHNVHSLPERNDPMNKAQPNIDRLGAKSPKLGEPEFFRVKCDVHPWMSAWIAVIDSPFFAITGKDGKFTLPKGLPNGDYTVVIWHEKYGTQEAKLNVKDGRGEVNFTVKAK